LASIPTNHQAKIEDIKLRENFLKKADLGNDS